MSKYARSFHGFILAWNKITIPEYNKPPTLTLPLGEGITTVVHIDINYILIKYIKYTIPRIKLSIIIVNEREA